MKMIKRNVKSLAALVGLSVIMASSVAYAAGDAGAYHMENPEANVGDRKSVLRGAKLFTENCMGCHSMSMMRYNRIAEDYDLDEDMLHAQGIIKDPDTKIGDYMMTSMAPSDAQEWLGKAPPDLTLITRAKSPEYVYNFLRSFYLDTSTVTGYNNAVLPNTSMPNVLSKFQSASLPVYDVHQEDGKEVKDLVSVQMAHTSELTDEQFEEIQAQYDQVTRDITNFMVYASEPSQSNRKSLGFWVILYLLILSVVLYQLKKSYWKHIH